VNGIETFFPSKKMPISIFLKTTITAFTGSSGSPVLYKNEVIGIVSITQQGSNYAGITPIEFFKRIVEEN
jgi:V8-like Glu-specific endopeptidase